MAEPKDEPNRNENLHTDTIVLRRSKRLIANRKRKFNESLSENDNSSKVTVRDFDERGYTKLDTINDDCIRQIAEYMNIIESLYFAATCRRMAYFFCTDIFPRKAKQISIMDIDVTRLLVTSPLDAYPSRISLKALKSFFHYLGRFVKVLTFEYDPFIILDSKTWRNRVIVLKYCKNLTKLSFSSDYISRKQAHELQRLISRFKNLKELELDVLDGITNNWCSSNCSPKVEKLTFLAKNIINKKFTDNFRNLSSLTIKFDVDAAVLPNDLATILDNNSHCLKSLTILDLQPTVGYTYIGFAQLISDKVPNMESLALKIMLADNTKSLFEMPHLKFLDINCTGKSINSLLRTLSKGCIEELKISHGTFDDDPNGPPLIFHKLKCFSLIKLQNVSSLLNLLNRSELPLIHSLAIMRTNEFHNELLRFIELKNTLKSFQFDFVRGKISPTLLQIINILKKTFGRTLKMEFLNRSLGIEDIKLLNANRNLINFKLINDPIQSIFY